MTLLAAEADPVELMDGSLVVEHDVKQAKAARPMVIVIDKKFAFINRLFE
jgi:hypothetical protein